MIHTPTCSKRLLAAAIHKKVNIYEINSASSDPVSICELCPNALGKKRLDRDIRRTYEQCDVGIFP